MLVFYKNKFDKDGNPTLGINLEKTFLSSFCNKLKERIDDDLNQLIIIVNEAYGIDFANLFFFEDPTENKSNYTLIRVKIEETIDELNKNR